MLGPAGDTQGSARFNSMATIRFVYKPAGLHDGASVNIPGQAQAPNELKPVKVDRWWRESSFDLWQGLEVREDPPDTMPAEWIDEIERPPPDRR